MSSNNNTSSSQEIHNAMVAALQRRAAEVSWYKPRRFLRVRLVFVGDERMHAREPRETTNFDVRAKNLACGSCLSYWYLYIRNVQEIQFTFVTFIWY